ncbi:hypothetical protein [Anaerocolumna xylanovorans]|uniref:Uncharacterized protein n=1 Tax=Anaerocolumna xylanovorans DSM 12503 TaxID=1121345 RepID=A0A1M7Y4Z5_9FIRM|nr:hypothetical protein [Anaerocolumna xylanovorans]SHO47247.1 hypothetical protein SAMN02745217_01478 [Anaerocolumna xylanovorans DSM 12503]
MKVRRITLFLGIMMIIAVLSACHRKEKEEPVDVTITPSPTLTVTPEVTEPVTPTLTPSPSGSEEDGKESEEEIKEEEDAEAENGEAELTEEEAADCIRKALEDEAYYYELLDDHLNVSDRIYYIYQVSDGGKVSLPNIIVDRASGKVMCYSSDGTISSITEHPLYKKSGASQNANNSKEQTGITKEEALKLLEKIPNKTLKLSKDLTEYTIIYDDWITNIKGVDCFGISVYEKGDLKDTAAGFYYVATDGSKIYRYDVVKDKTKDITP